MSCPTESLPAAAGRLRSIASIKRMVRSGPGSVKENRVLQYPARIDRGDSVRGRTTNVAQQRVGIGFIGAGGIARERHLPGLKAVEGVELVAVANRHRQSAEKV